MEVCIEKAWDAGQAQSHGADIGGNTNYMQREQSPRMGASNNIFMAANHIAPYGRIDMLGNIWPTFPVKLGTQTLK